LTPHSPCLQGFWGVLHLNRPTFWFQVAFQAGAQTRQD
jgi:hypothetical protein